jgi:NADPH:quinone reductase-like Zn-dependent oxidoreductase
MKAAFVVKYGGPEVLEIRETPIPVPRPDQILVRVRAIGLNFADVFGRFGVYPGTPKPPFIPGLEFSGDVVAVGSDVRLFRGRERVMGYSKLGSHAEYVTLNEHYATPIPDSMSYEDGAGFLVTSMSAYHGIIRLANIRRGEKLLVHAAAGGVGLATVQLAAHLGAEVFGTAGTPEKVELARKHGATHVYNYSVTDFAEEIKRETNGYGIDVVMDSVGGDVFKHSWSLLAPMGRYVLFGISAVTGKGALNRLKVATAFSSMKPIFPPNLLSVNRGIFGFNLGTLTGKEAYFREAADDVLEYYRKGVIRVLIGKTFPFEDIVEAHRYLQTRQSVGKVLVLVS